VIFITDNLENCLKLSYSYRLATHWRGKLITSVRINSSCRTIKVDQKVKIYISRKRCKHIFFGDKFEFFSFYVSVSDLSSWNLTIQRQQVITPNGSWIMPNGSRVMSNGSRIMPIDCGQNLTKGEIHVVGLTIRLRTRLTCCPLITIQLEKLGKPWHVRQKVSCCYCLWWSLLWTVIFSLFTKVLSVLHIKLHDVKNRRQNNLPLQLNLQLRRLLRPFL